LRLSKTSSGKGEFGYIRRQKRIRTIRTILCFAVAFAIYLTGYLLNKGDRRNIYTIIAMLGMIPAALSCVSAIMMGLRKPMDGALYERIRESAGNLHVAYELYFTTYERNLFVDGVAVGDGTVAAFTHVDANGEVIRAMEQHLEKSLRAAGYHRKVKIFQNEKQFLERLRAMNLRDSQTAEDEAARETLLALAL
jgi:hypothetical protein